jgi:hypothetical protein
MGYFAAAAMQTTASTSSGPSQIQQLVLDKLLEVNLDDLSPREAYKLLENLQTQLEE